MQSDKVKRVLSQYRELQAKHDVHIAIYPDDYSGDAMRTLRQKITIIESWLRILTEEERFIITKHLLDRLPWPLVVVEYEKRWSRSCGKAERTLKRYQAVAIEKIATFIHRNGYAPLIAPMLFTQCANDI